MNGVDGNDLNQGQVGNCWFVAACSTLAGVPALWNNVVVHHQDQVRPFDLFLVVSLFISPLPACHR